MDRVRRAAFIAAFSVATDLAIGQPLAFAWKSCVLAVRLARALGDDHQLIYEVYHQALLRYIGCNADTYAMSALFGDEIAFRREFALIDMGRDREVISVVFQAIRRVANDKAFPAAIWSMLQGLMRSKSASAAILSGHCEVAGRIATRLGFDEAVIRNVAQLYERWDGNGIPHGLQGEAVSLAVRIVTLAQDIIILGGHFGAAKTLDMIKKRSGSAYDPQLVKIFLDSSDKFLNILDEEINVSDVLQAEPQPHFIFDESAIDEACLAMADFSDMRLPFKLGHSRAVATLSAAAAKRLSLPERDITTLQRAALIHDLGEVSISASVFLQPRHLSPHDNEAIRLHPYYTERIFAIAQIMPEVAAIAGQHHERVDGSGYHRGLKGAGASTLSRILAAVEYYQNLIEDRPHRPAVSQASAAMQLKDLARRGQLDNEAVGAVLESAGHKWTAATDRPKANLSQREIEILQGLARGETAKQIARHFGLSPKTVDNHIQNIYAKAGISTRGAAVLYAVEQGFLAQK